MGLDAGCNTTTYEASTWFLERERIPQNVSLSVFFLEAKVSMSPEEKRSHFLVRRSFLQPQGILSGTIPESAVSRGQTLLQQIKSALFYMNVCRGKLDKQREAGSANLLIKRKIEKTTQFILQRTNQISFPTR